MVDELVKGEFANLGFSLGFGERNFENRFMIEGNSISIAKRKRAGISDKNTSGLIQTNISPSRDGGSRIPCSGDRCGTGLANDSV
jgi:hypothetical protein